MRFLIFAAALLLSGPAHTHDVSGMDGATFLRQGPNGGSSGRVASRVVQVAAATEPTSGAERNSAGSLSDHLPAAGWAQIPGSSPHGVLYYQEVAEADIGKVLAVTRRVAVIKVGLAEGFVARVGIEIAE